MSANLLTMSNTSSNGHIVRKVGGISGAKKCTRFCFIFGRRICAKVVSERGPESVPARCAKVLCFHTDDPKTGYAFRPHFLNAFRHNFGYRSAAASAATIRHRLSAGKPAVKKYVSKNRAACDKTGFHRAKGFPK